ncbi:MAG: hypothetical protein IPN29_06130 [Saprospiraceae bacterium]|nr:hypothetical protein [Saprospiraceae bacterium]
MKIKLDKILEEARSVGSKIVDKAGELGAKAMDKSMDSIEKWLDEFPLLEAGGLTINSFALVMQISPRLEVELTGMAAEFDDDRLNALIEEYKDEHTLVTMVFKAIRQALYIQRKICIELKEPLIVKLRLGISPEVIVHIGQPRVP